MTSRFERLLVNLDGRGRSGRAFAEALRDCAHEWRGVNAPVQRLGVIARSVGALGRVACAVVIADAIRMPLLGALVLTLPPSIALAVSGWGHHTLVSNLEWSGRLMLAAYAFPQAFFVVLPIATFAYVVASQSRCARSSIARVAVAAFALAIGVGLGVVPFANREFHAMAHTASGGRSGMLFGPGELGPADLITRAFDAPFGVAAGVVGFRLGLSALAVALALFGSWVATLPTALAKRHGLGLLGLYGFAIAALPSSWELGGHASAAVGLLPWLGLCAIGLALRALRKAHRVAAAMASIALVVAVSVSLQAQMRPDFSGRWTLEGAPADNPVLMLIRQRSGDITLMDSDAQTGPLHHVRFVFEQVVSQESDVANIDVASVASWLGDALVVKTTLSARVPKTVLSEKEARWSLDAEGRIVVVEVSRRPGRPDAMQRTVFARR